MSATHGPGALNKYTNGRSDRVLLAARGPYITEICQCPGFEVRSINRGCQPPRQSADLILRAARSAASRRMIQHAVAPPLRSGASFETRLRRSSGRGGWANAQYFGIRTRG